MILVDKSTKNAVLLVAVMASFLTPFMASSINVALPNIQKDFDVDAMILTWVPTTYLLSCCVFMIPLGKLADLVMVSQDIFQVPMDELPQTKVLLTMVGGQVRYCAEE